MDGTNKPAEDTKDASSHQGGFFDFVDLAKDFVSHPIQKLESAAQHPLDSALNAAKDIANIGAAPLAIVDWATGSHTSKTLEDVEKGAIQELKTHPLKLVGDAAASAGATALAVAALPAEAPAAVVAALGTGLFVGGYEVWKNRDELFHNGISTKALTEDPKLLWNGVWADSKEFLKSAKEWGLDAKEVSAPGQHPADKEAAAENGLKEAGATIADSTAAMAGGYAGGWGASRAALQGKLHDVIPEKFKGKVDAGEQVLEKVPQVPTRFIGKGVPESLPKPPTAIPPTDDSQNKKS